MPVVVDDGAEGLAAMLGGLLAAAAERPERARVLARMRGTVTVDVPDAEVTVGLRFSGGTCRVSSGGIPGSALRIEMPSDVLMGFSTIPLLYGLPSPLAPEGRELARRLLRREVRIGGLLRHPTLVRQLDTVLSVV